MTSHTCAPAVPLAPTARPVLHIGGATLGRPEASCEWRTGWVFDLVHVASTCMPYQVVGQVQSWNLQPCSNHCLASLVEAL